MIQLTKREQFAMAAMQGLLSNPVTGDSALHDKAQDWVKDITESSVEFADALIAELDKKLKQRSQTQEHKKQTKFSKEELTEAIKVMEYLYKNWHSFQTAFKYGCSHETLMEHIRSGCKFFCFWGTDTRPELYRAALHYAVANGIASVGLNDHGFRRYHFYWLN